MSPDGARIAAAFFRKVLHARRRDRLGGIPGDIAQQRMSRNEDRVRQAMGGGCETQETVELTLGQLGFR